MSESELLTEEQSGLPGMEGKTRYEDAEKQMLTYLENNPVSINFMMEIYGYTDEAIQKWVRKDIIPKADRGRYFFIPCIRARETHLKNNANNSGWDKIRDHKTETEIERSRKLRLENDETEKLLVNAKELEEKISKYLIEVRNIRLLPRSYAKQLLDISLKFINALLGRKKIKKMEIPSKEKKDFLIKIEETLLTEIDKALESLSKGLENGISTGSNK